MKSQTIEADGHYNPLDTPEMICTVLSKLPLHLQDRWSLNTPQLRGKHSKEPHLTDLTNFVEDEITLVNDRLYSRNTVSQYVDRGPRYIGKREREEVQCHGNWG